MPHRTGSYFHLHLVSDSTGETLTVADLDDKVAAEALVRNVYTGPDHVTRLNLQFPDVAGFERLLHAAGAPPLPEGS